MKRKVLVGSLALTILITLLGLGLPIALADDTLELTIDIKPCKDPNVLNVNQPGWLPVAIYENGYTVDPETVELNGVSVLEWKYKEGYLLVKFDATTVIATFDEVNNGDVLTLTLTGELDDGTPFVGYDDVVILKKGKGG